MRYESFGPVANPDGTPTQVTRDMLAGTGRDPEAFAAEAAATQVRKQRHIAAFLGDCGNVTCVTCAENRADMAWLDDLS